MAVVYLAQDLRHKRRVALKVLRPEISAVMGTERFLREIETLANLTHPHILPLHDSGSEAVWSALCWISWPCAAARESAIVTRDRAPT